MAKLSPEGDELLVAERRCAAEVNPQDLADTDRGTTLSHSRVSVHPLRPGFRHDAKRQPNGSGISPS